MCSIGKHTKYGFIKLLLILIGLNLSSAGTAAMAGEPIEPANPTPSNHPLFVVSTRDGLISVKATEASLKDVIERIGKELGIEVDAQIGDEDTVTTEFQDLTLEAALKRLSGNYAYTTNKQGEEITKLFLFTKGAAPASHGGGAEAKTTQTGRRAGSSEPFKFEFDPMEAMDKGE